MKMKNLSKIFKGNLVYSLNESKLNIIENGLLGVDVNGKIAFIEEDQKKFETIIKNNREADYQDLGKKFLLPGKKKKKNFNPD